MQYNTKLNDSLTDQNMKGIVASGNFAAIGLLTDEQYNSYRRYLLLKSLKFDASQWDTNDWEDEVITLIDGMFKNEYCYHVTEYVDNVEILDALHDDGYHLSNTVETLHDVWFDRYPWDADDPYSNEMREEEIRY
jgi:hypothetical protein